jgi:hypothetical protein
MPSVLALNEILKLMKTATAISRAAGVRTDTSTHQVLNRRSAPGTNMDQATHNKIVSFLWGISGRCSPRPFQARQISRRHPADVRSATTGKASWFLPLNKGWNDGAGNPPNPHGLKTDYLWRDLLTPRSLTNILENYAQIVEEVHSKTGRNSCCLPSADRASRSRSTYLSRRNSQCLGSSSSQ